MADETHKPADPVPVAPVTPSATGAPFGVPATASPFPATPGVTGEIPLKVVTLAVLPAPAQVGDKNIAPTTTAAEDATKASQRTINYIWESMQAFIAASVVCTTLWVSAHLALLIAANDSNEKQAAMSITAFMLISNLVSLVIGFYFGRTDSQRDSGNRQSRLS